jgi:hypothetical protein
VLFALLSLFGYDRKLVAELSHAECQRLGTIAAGWLLSLLLIAVPMGYSLWLVEHSLALACVVAVLTFALTLNLLRVAIAGGGLQAGSTAAQVRDYRPGLAPAVFVGLLGLIFAQPAQLPLDAAHLDPLIAQHREQLVAEHRARVETTPEVRSFDAYGAELASCEFVVRRLALLWQTPAQAARFTALYCLVVLLPALFGQYVAVGAVRKYQLLRYRRATRFVAVESIAQAAAMDATLADFASYRDARAWRSLDPHPLAAAPAASPGQLSLQRRMPG